MKPSPQNDVRTKYDTTADDYATMMDAEIDLPIYADVLGRLHARLADTSGLLVDTACGPGHMLARYHDRHDPRRPLLGVDLSRRMVAIAAERLGHRARLLVGDMQSLPAIGDASAAALLNYFALHHLDPDGAAAALHEWHRILRPGGQLLLATWEGSGAIDYGDSADIVALRYGRDEVVAWVTEAGFVVDRCVVEPVDEIPMDAIYLEGTRAP